jgi:hypothetical protein
MTNERFLVGQDYGMGGIWAIVLAASKHEILNRCPNVEIFDDPPSWMTPEDLARISERVTLTIDEAEAYFAEDG